jgi:AcrR family transcriptional regulator
VPEDQPQLPVPPWRQRPARPPRQQLSADAIVAAAMRIMAAEGLDAVSMRRVAEALGTGPASLYAHVRNKQDLHELMLDEIFKDVRVPTPDPSRWQQQLKELAFAVTRIMLESPGAARIVMHTLIPTTPGLLLIMEGVSGILRAGGLPDQYIAYAADALSLYCTAFAYEASMWPSSEAGQAEAQRRLGEINAYLDSLPPDRFPELMALRSQFQADDGMKHFEFAIDVFIAGLARYTSSD